MPSPALLLIGSGDELYRRFSLEIVARRYPVLLLDRTEATWQLPYLTGHAVADLTDDASWLAAVARLSRIYPIGGVLTWSEWDLGLTARIAEQLSLPHLSSVAALRCRDKSATRTALANPGVPQPQSIAVSTFEQAQAAAQSVGYPVVCKPAASAGSMGVQLAHDEKGLADAYAFAAQAQHGSEARAVLIEEYADGPEVSVECVTVDGHTQAVALRHTMIGHAPYFEEIGHDYGADDIDGHPAAAPAVDAVRALGISTGITHVELRMTSRGPRIIEANGRLAGDFAPRAHYLASGIDLVAAAADIAMGVTPDLRRTRHAAASVRFVYPTHPGVYLGSSVDPALKSASWLERLEFEHQPGARVAPPPAGDLQHRLAHLITTGRTLAQARAHAEQALAGVTVHVAPATTGSAA